MCSRVLLLALAFPVAAAAAAGSPAAPPTSEELETWLMTYYEHPAPEEFVERVRQMVELGTLRTNRPEANQIFLAKVMEANPGRLAGWLDELRDLAPEDAAVVHRAASASQTREGREWLERNGQGELAASPPPPILANEPMLFEPYHLDQLWEWFFATGDERPVRRIVGFFVMAPSDPQGPGELPAPPADPTDVAASVGFRLARPAVWSTAALATQQDRVFEILKAIEADNKLTPRGRAWLEQAIAIATQRRAEAAKNVRGPRP